ncbi:MAG: hypothetical protein ABSC77_12570 [Terracidiphilus sp.]|jgi:hypothetical protein
MMVDKIFPSTAGPSWGTVSDFHRDLWGVAGPHNSSNLPDNSTTRPNARRDFSSGLPSEPEISISGLSALASGQFGGIHLNVKTEFPLAPNPSETEGLPPA